MINFLEWDSAFFNLNIGKCNAFSESYSIDQIKNVLFQSRKSFDLTYLVLSPQDKEAIAYLETLGYPVMDKKVTFKKTLTEENYPPASQIQAYKHDHVDQALLSMTLQSGIYSRFKVDPQFPPNSYERLYTRWIENSVAKANADFVFVDQENDQLSGFITLAFHKDYSDIGLFAVDQQHRGKGIGSRLIDHVFHMSKLNGMKAVCVVTQLNNEVACRVYEKKGFLVERIEYIYHIWTK